MSRPPLIETLIKDLGDRGHSFSFSKVDANNYLLPQRRNRVFGCSSANGLKTSEKMASEQHAWKAIFGKLGLGPKDQHFSLDDFLEPGLDPSPLHGPEDVRNWDLIQAKLKKNKVSQDACVCLHMGSSEKRIEYMVGASTCIRPSHEIWCSQVQRPLVGIESLRLQGSFPEDYPYPEEVRGLPENLSRDLAGNAFPTTVLQANVIASMISHAAWGEMASRADFSSPPRQSKQRRQRNVHRPPPAPDSADVKEEPKKNNKRPSGDGMLVWQKVLALCGPPYNWDPDENNRESVSSGQG